MTFYPDLFPDPPEDVIDQITNPGALARVTDATPADVLQPSIVIPAIVYDRAYRIRSGRAVERARAWEAKGLEWTGDLSVVAAADEAALCWIAAVRFLLEAP